MTTGSGIQHVFVLMLENRSFDHLLGSRDFGQDALSGLDTNANGLTGAESNLFNGQTYEVSHPAAFIMPADPGHEFPNVLEQLAGPAATYPPGGAYPVVDDSGFVTSYAASGGAVNPGEIMRCYSPAQLPVLNALAREFVLCDNWHASMPGPTWPNRMFVHAASSGGLDHSPTVAEIAEWEALDGFQFPNGTIFDALTAKGISWGLYAGDDFPMVAALKRIQLDKVRHFRQFAADLAQPALPYTYTYTFIEPSYDILNDYRNSTSQHPLSDVTLGEGLIKATYEAVRNSPIWPHSLLMITWDEHGGFYDHALPPSAVAPGDTVPGGAYNEFDFTFEQYGPRVPGIVISPRIPKNLIDHRLYDHASIPATLEKLFALKPLTARDRVANRLDSLLTLATPRADAPLTLPAPARSVSGATQLTAAAPLSPAVNSRGLETVNSGNLPAVLHTALREEIQTSPPDQKQTIIYRFRKIQTRAQARQYLQSRRKNAARPIG